MRLIQHMIAALLAACATGAAIAAPLTALPGGTYWRTFSKPLALGTGEMLIFQRDGGNPVVWRINWKTQQTESTPMPEVSLVKDGRYTPLSNQEGLWLIGQRTVLVRPNGQRIVAETGFDEPASISLDDGSVAVFGKSRGGTGGGIVQLKFNASSGRIEVIERGVLSYDGTPNQKGQTYREPGYGHLVARLSDGRLLMMGGSNTPKLASIITPRKEAGAWPIKPVAPMPHPRVGASTITLADGRVVITGPSHLNCYFDASDTRGADVYDAASNRWTSLPPMPFVPCADAYGADAPSIGVTPGGALLVSGHLEPHIMMLQRDPKSPTGFAESWSVHGQFKQERIGGVIQALSDTEAVVAGGVSNREGNFGGCCYAVAGFDRTSIGQTNSREVRALRYIGAAAAQRDKLLFTAGGRRFGFTSTGQARYSAYAELIDLGTGNVQQLPTMPFVSGGAQAAWIDDDHILVKGVPAQSDRGYAPGENLSSYMPTSSGALAIFDLKHKQWGKMFEVPALVHSTLLDVNGKEARWLSSNGELQWLDLATHAMRTTSPLGVSRFSAMGRLVAPGRLVVAGGTTQPDAISLIDQECEAQQPKGGCPEHYAGIGPLAPSTGAESAVYEGPAANSEVWRDVVPGASASTIAIGRDGTVYLLASSSNNESHRLVRTVAATHRWQAIPAPSGGSLCKDDCALLLASDPRDPKRELLFFRQGPIGAMYIDDTVAATTVKVWLWDEAQRNWQLVLTTDGMSARATPKQLGGLPILSMGWHLPVPILWTAKP